MFVHVGNELRKTRTPSFASIQLLGVSFKINDINFLSQNKKNHTFFLHILLVFDFFTPEEDFILPCRNFLLVLEFTWPLPGAMLLTLFPGSSRVVTSPAAMLKAEKFLVYAYVFYFTTPMDEKNNHFLEYLCYFIQDRNRWNGANAWERNIDRSPPPPHFHW